MTYCNDVFLRVAGYKEEEVLGQPHSLIRHPDMPRCVFHLLWETIGREKEIFAYVKNRTKSGDYYWVLAHVTPSYDLDGTLNGYHSNRRVPEKSVISDVIKPLYQQLHEIENQSSSRKDGMNNASSHLQNILADNGIGYDEFIAKFAFAA